MIGANAPARALYADISPDARHDMLVAQNYCCGICHCDLRADHVRAHLDHDHKDGLVRAYLCASCNGCIGQVEAGRRDAVSPYLEYLTAYGPIQLPCRKQKQPELRALIRIPTTLLMILEQHARRNRRSRNSEIVVALETYLSERQEHVADCTDPAIVGYGEPGELVEREEQTR